MQPHDRVLGRGYEARHQQSLPTRDRRRANVSRIALKTFVGEVVMKNEEFAPLHRAAIKKVVLFRLARPCCARWSLPLCNV
jgi:hypothetical protein